MYRWTGGFRLHLGIAFLVLSFQVGHCQGAKSKFEVGNSIGVLRFDKNLAFDPSPSFGLGAGYNITNSLQLNLSFSYNPTQQRISQAASKQHAEYSIFNYHLSTIFFIPKAMIGKIRPFIIFGAGGFSINPGPVKLELGGGNTISVEPPNDNKTAVNFGAGICFQILKQMKINLEARRYLFKLEDFTKSKVTGSNKYLGLGLIRVF